ncbi:Large ribosomal subunit protein bL19m [Cladobotryum mycophilum]|uniref:Large ribosomal subunit protein bL19m n=1 Tax=Cladobotryum mycophilum TaxID=491253 RepID=A0ABR0SD78_9HYPO
MAGSIGGAGEKVRPDQSHHSPSQPPSRERFAIQFISKFSASNRQTQLRPQSNYDERRNGEAAGWLSQVRAEEDTVPEDVTAVFGDEMEKQKISRFQVWPQLPSVRTNHPDPMPTLRQQEITRLDSTGARTRLFSREHADSAKVGDVLMVTTTSGEPFSGAFIQIRRRGVDTAILLRGQLMKTGVEMWFKIYSPTVTGIDIIWRRPKRARRARLTFMRKPGHDMGSVDSLVSAWKKERYALRSKAKIAGGGGGKQRK